METTSGMDAFSRAIRFRPATSSPGRPEGGIVSRLCRARCVAPAATGKRGLSARFRGPEHDLGRHCSTGGYVFGAGPSIKNGTHVQALIGVEFFLHTT